MTLPKCTLVHLLIVLTLVGNMNSFAFSNLYIRRKSVITRPEKDISVVVLDFYDDINKMMALLVDLYYWEIRCHT